MSRSGCCFLINKCLRLSCAVNNPLVSIIIPLGNRKSGVYFLYDKSSHSIFKGSYLATTFLLCKSFCMITDISGTAYTYAFLNESPVIFFSNNLIEQNFKYSNYIKDRVKIGYISKNTNEILKIIQKINKNKTKFRKSIKNLRLKLSNFGNVKKQMSKKINNITFKNEISI